MTSPDQVQLDAPGAGLPAMEHFIGGFLFRLALKKHKPEHFTREFQKERGRISALLNDSSQACWREPVLIKRPRGLEDSSRRWSVAMTLEHLRICNTIFASLMEGLSKGELPDRPARTEDVKPSPEAGPEVRATYEESCENWLQSLEHIDDLNTETRFAHPWFGPLNAAGWQALGALHMKVHRIQIERILAGLAPH